MGLGETIVVPVISPSSAAALSELAARLAVPDGGLVVPVSVAAPGAEARHVAAATAVLRSAEEAAIAAGARAKGRLMRDASVAEAVIDAVARTSATLTVMGWQGLPAHAPAPSPSPGGRGAYVPGRVFGQLIGSIIGRARTPLAVVRHSANPCRRILLPIAEDSLLIEGLRGLGLAGDLVQRLARTLSLPVTLLHSGETHAQLPERILGLSDRVHHDPRRVDRALASAVRGDDLVVVAVDPTEAGLRAATTSVAWSAPEAGLLLAVDTGHDPQGDLAEAVRLAGTPPPAGDEEVAGRHEVTVTIGCREDTPVGDELVAILGSAGTVTDVSAWNDRRGRAWRQATLHVDGHSASAAVGLVMDLLADSEAFAHADITYEVHRPRAVQH